MISFLPETLLSLLNGSDLISIDYLSAQIARVIPEPLDTPLQGLSRLPALRLSCILPYVFYRDQT